MASQVQKTKAAPQEKAPAAEVKPKVDEKQELKDAMDSLMDEIDAVLEENAEEFVRGYVQKGGQ